MIIIMMKECPLSSSSSPQSVQTFILSIQPFLSLGRRVVNEDAYKKPAINSIICSCHRRQYHCMYQCSSSPTLKQIAIVAFSPLESSNQIEYVYFFRCNADADCEMSAANCRCEPKLRSVRSAGAFCFPVTSASFFSVESFFTVI